MFFSFGLWVCLVVDWPITILGHGGVTGISSAPDVGEDFFHLVFSAAHDERLALVDTADAPAAENATALYACKVVGCMVKQIGFNEFELFGAFVHGDMVLRGVSGAFRALFSW